MYEFGENFCKRSKSLCRWKSGRQLGLKSGDKILFLQKQNGEIVVSNASAAAIRKAQAAFSGAAEALGVSSEDDIQALVDEARYGKGTLKCMIVAQFLESEGAED